MASPITPLSIDPEPAGAGWDPPPRREPAWRPSGLRRVLRSRTTYWAAALVLAAFAGLTAQRLTAEARAIVADLGETRTVLVASATTDAGMPIVAELVEVPVRVVPDGALTETTDRTARRAIAAGAVVTSLDIGDDSGLRPGEVAVAVPVTPTTPPVRPGDPVVVVVGADPYAGTVAGTLPARVVDLTEGQLLLAIDDDQLATAATALQGGTVTVALAG